MERFRPRYRWQTPGGFALPVCDTSSAFVILSVTKMTADVAQTGSLRCSLIAFSADASQTASMRYLPYQVFCGRLANRQFALPLPPRGSAFLNPYRQIWAETCWTLLEFASGIARYSAGIVVAIFKLSIAR
jgi:hypothetical protein